MQSALMLLMSKLRAGVASLNRTSNSYFLSEDFSSAQLYHWKKLHSVQKKFICTVPRRDCTRS